MEVSATNLVPPAASTWSCGSTEATVTSAPARRRTWIMITASISSVPKPMGTRTFFGGIALGAVGREMESAGFGVSVLCRGGVTAAKGARAAGEAVTGERAVGG